MYSVDILEEVDEKLPNAASALPDSLPTPPRCREGDAPVVRVRGMLSPAPPPPPPASASLLVSDARERDPFEVYTSSSESLGSACSGGGSVFGDGGEIGGGEGVDGEGDVRMLDVDVGVGDGFLEVGKEWGCGVRMKGDRGSEGGSESESEGELMERRALVSM